MNITVIGPVYPYRGGISHFNTLLIRTLIDNKHHTQVISFRRQYPKWLYPGTTDNDPSRYPLKVDAEYLLDSLKPWTWYKTAKHIAQFHPDLVLIQWWTTFWAIPFAWISWYLRTNRLRVAFLIHNVLPHEIRPWDRPLTKLALRQGQTFIVQTEGEKEKLQNLLPNSEIYLHPHPIYRIFSKSRLDKVEARKILGIQNNKFILLSFGIVRSYKNIKLVLNALSIQKNQDFSPTYIIAGEIWESIESYHRLIKHLKLTDHVRIENRYIPNEEVPIYFSAADLLIAMYSGGTQSGSVTIALDYGLPIITTPRIAAGIDKAYQHRLTVVPPGESASLASAINSSMEQPQQSEESSNPTAADWSSLVEMIVQIAS